MPWPVGSLLPPALGPGCGVCSAVKHFSRPWSHVCLTSVRDGCARCVVGPPGTLGTHHGGLVITGISRVRTAAEHLSLWLVVGGVVSKWSQWCHTGALSRSAGRMVVRESRGVWVVACRRSRHGKSQGVGITRTSDYGGAEGGKDVAHEGCMCCSCFLLRVDGNCYLSRRQCPDLMDLQEGAQAVLAGPPRR